MPPAILVIVFKGIGDVLLTTPLLRALKKKMPGSRLYFLTRKPSLKILRHNPNLTGVFCREDSPLKAIRAAGVDITMDFMRSSVSGCYSLCSGASKRLAFHYTGGRLFYNLMPEKRPGGYTVLDRLQLAEPLGVAPDGPEPDLFFAPENAARAEAFLSANGAGATGLTVTFDITSPREYRRAPAALFAALADRLLREFGARVIFLSGPGELAYVSQALAAAKEKHLLAPDFDLLDLAALQARCALHVGTSSAPMHIAVSQKLPTFTIYAPEDSPLSWSPPGPRHGWVQGALQDLPFETVWDKLGSHVRSLQGGRQ